MICSHGDAYILQQRKHLSIIHLILDRPWRIQYFRWIAVSTVRTPERSANTPRGNAISTNRQRDASLESQLDASRQNLSSLGLTDRLPSPRHVLQQWREC